jgi:hypothetical protein
MQVRGVLLCAVVVAINCAFVSASGELPPGKAQAKVKATCTQCHTIANITKKPRTRAEWSKVLDKMEGYGADVEDKDRASILDYLTANFGLGKGSSSKSTKATKQQ